MEWSTTHSSTFTAWVCHFFRMLISFLNAKQNHLLVLSQDSIWLRFYALCISLAFTRKLDEFFASSVAAPSFPAFTHYVSRKILQYLVHSSYQINSLEHHDDYGDISLLECEALRYVAGYVSEKSKSHLLMKKKKLFC